MSSFEEQLSCRRSFNVIKQEELKKFSKIDLPDSLIYRNEWKPPGFNEKIRRIFIRLFGSTEESKQVFRKITYDKIRVDLSKFIQSIDRLIYINRQEVYVAKVAYMGHYNSNKRVFADLENNKGAILNIDKDLKDQIISKADEIFCETFLNDSYQGITQYRVFMTTVYILLSKLMDNNDKEVFRKSLSDNINALSELYFGKDYRDYSLMSCLAVGDEQLKLDLDMFISVYSRLIYFSEACMTERVR